MQDLSYLLQTLENEPRAKHFHKLNKAMCELIEDFGLVGFETLAVEDKASMMKLVRLVDKVTGYIFLPAAGDAVQDNMHALFSSAAGAMPGDPYADISDVQERWGDRRAEFDAAQDEQWEREWLARKNAEAAVAAAAKKEQAQADAQHTPDTTSTNTV